MNRRNETAICTALEQFIQQTIPEYITDSGKMIIAENGISNLLWRMEDTYSEASCTVHGEDFQAYSPTVTVRLNDRHVDYACNCMESFGSPCRHVAALALSALSSIAVSHDTPTETTTIRPEWRQSFRNFFTSNSEPETGRHYFLFRFFPEPGRLSVEFYRARQNKTGLSTVRQAVTLEDILKNPDWCEYSPELPKILKQIAQYLDYYGHRVEIPDGLLSWFFWALRTEEYIFWEDTEKPCTIESSTMDLKLHPSLDEDGLRFDIMLQKEEKKPFSIQKDEDRPDQTVATFHGQIPLWVCWNQCFYPVQTCLNHDVIQSLVQASPIIPQEDISEFLDRVWTRLPSSELYEQEEFLKIMEPVFQPGSYNPKLFLDEEGSLLTLEIQNVYESIQNPTLYNEQ